MDPPMLFPEINAHIKAYDDRRDVAILDTKEEAVLFATKYFLQLADKAIAQKNSFAAALSGGSTPKSVFEMLSSESYRNLIDWRKGDFFFSDERAVPADHKESNYYNALQSGFKNLPTKSLSRMEAEAVPEIKALDYEHLIERTLNGHSFDIVMLGMGPDGHTASLFPKTHALHSSSRKVVANFVPKLNAWRMTFTFHLINSSNGIMVLALGSDKAAMIKTVLAESQDSNEVPAIRVGSPSHKALWILDRASASIAFER